MTHEEVDKVLQKASGVAPEVEPALLKRIADSINTSLQPVRPLPPTWVLTGGLLLICAVVAVTAAVLAGLYGIEKLAPWQRIMIFLTLGILVWVAGREFVSQLIPGSRHLSAGALLTSVSAALLVVFSLMFHDYHIDHFFAAGIACLLTGVLLAIPSAILGCSLLRHGFAVSPVAAGLVGGAFAGLCGVTMLELHCADFQALHVLVWHTAVVPIGAAAGALVGWVLHRHSRAERVRK
jgi:Negative regulator of sigma F